MNLEYERNHSHYHCWEQVDNEDSDIEPQDTPDCGQPLKSHKQCCLCDTPYGHKDKEVSSCCGAKKDYEGIYESGIGIQPGREICSECCKPFQEDKRCDYCKNRGCVKECDCKCHYPNR